MNDNWIKQPRLTKLTKAADVQEALDCAWTNLPWEFVSHYPGMFLAMIKEAYRHLDSDQVVDFPLDAGTNIECNTPEEYFTTTISVMVDQPDYAEMVSEFDLVYWPQIQDQTDITREAVISAINRLACRSE